MEGLCGRPRKLIHKELQNQELDALTHKGIRNISRNMHKAPSSQLLPLPIDTEETHEAWSAVHVLTSSKEQFLFVTDSEENSVTFYCKSNLQFLSPINEFCVNGAFKSVPKSVNTNYSQFTNSAPVTMCHLHFSYWPINIQRPTKMYSDIL